MPATIDDLNKSLQDILKSLQAANKASGAGSGSGTGTGGAKGPQTLRDVFANSFRQSLQRGSGLQQALGRGTSALGGMAGRGAALAGPLGAIGGPVVGIGMELAKVPGKVKEFVEGLHEANRALAQFSPTMAAIMAKSDVMDMMRNLRKGEMVAESAGKLAETRGRLNEAMMPAEAGMQNLQNAFGNLGGSIVSNFLEKSGFSEGFGEILNTMADNVNDLAEWFRGKKEGDKETSWQEDLEWFMRQEEKRVAQKKAGPLAAPVGAAFQDPRQGPSPIRARLQQRGAHPRLDG